MARESAFESHVLSAFKGEGDAPLRMSEIMERAALEHRDARPAVLRLAERGLLQSVHVTSAAFEVGARPPAWKLTDAGRAALEGRAR